MPAPTTAICNTFKQELMQALHNFTLTTGHAFRAALYKAGASVVGTHGASDTNYSSMGADELATGGGYTAGGNTLTNVTPTLDGGTAITDFADVSWASATFTTSGCMIYNSTSGNRAVSNHSFGSDQAVVSGTLTIQWPAPAAATAIIRIG
jgi:hypothetical protein